MTNEARKLFELSDETRILIAELRKPDVGDVITYDQMRKITGKDIQREKRSALATARWRLEQDEGVFFGVVVGIGLQRVTDAEAARSQERRLNHIHKSAARSERRAAAINFENVPTDERAAHVARTTFFGLIRKATSAKGQNKILSAVNSHEEQHKLDLRKALKALMP